MQNSNKQENPKQNKKPTNQTEINVLGERKKEPLGQVVYPIKKYRDSQRHLYDELTGDTLSIYSTVIVDREFTPMKGENIDSTCEFAEDVCQKIIDLVKSIKTNGNRCSLRIVASHIVNTPERKFVDE